MKYDKQEKLANSLPTQEAQPPKPAGKGGARPGAGRPPFFKESSKRIIITVPTRLINEIRELVDKFIKSNINNN